MPTLIALVLSFTKIGLISLGGGNSMLKLIEFEAINTHHWIGKEEFVSMIGTSFLFPGLTAVKLSGLIGYKIAGLPGLIAATLAINLPGILLATCGFKILNAYNNPATQKIMTAVQYGSLALLAAAAYSIAESIISSYFSWAIVLTTLVFFLCLVFLQLSPFWGFLAFIGVSFFVIH